MPIDIAALAYHWSAVKITRLTRFFAAFERGVCFLERLGFDVLLLAIIHPLIRRPKALHAQGSLPWLQRGRK
jgi:hypothetical protein